MCTRVVFQPSIHYVCMYLCAVPSVVMCLVSTLLVLCVCPCPPLQAFLEDPLGGKSGPSHPPQRRPNIPLSLPQTTALEERIREELTLLGLLEPVEVGGPCGSGCGLMEGGRACSGLRFWVDVSAEYPFSPSSPHPSSSPRRRGRRMRFWQSCSENSQSSEQ